VVSPIICPATCGGWTLSRRVEAALALSAALLLGGCATPQAFVGKPLTKGAGEPGYRVTDVLARRGPDDLRVVISFSGGGMRASALSFGVLEQLAEDRVRPAAGGEPRRLLDEVDIVSAVSGGAVTAAYWALYGDRIFEDFRRRFLLRDVSGGLKRTFFLDPRTWFRLASTGYSRGDVYADYLDRKLFRGATFRDLDHGGGRPFLVLNATDIGTAARFEFTQDHLDLLCGDLDSFPLARAVAASSSVPALLTPITLANSAGRCAYRMPEWVAVAADGATESRRHLQASAMQAYADPARYGWLHLVDGALGDNLGVRAAMDALSDRDDPSRMRPSAIAPGQHLVFIEVNANDWQAERIGGSRKPPDAVAMLRLLGTVPVDRYTIESKALLRETLRRWMRDAGGEGRLHIIEIDLDDLRDDPRFGRLSRLPTALDAKPADVDELRCAARVMLEADAEYRRLLREMGVTGGARPGLAGCRGP
jgi:NTE family protein